MYENDGKEENRLSQKKYIVCPDCGEQILMVPVLSQMIETIQSHLSTHKDHGDYPKHDHIQHPKEPGIGEGLAEQVLIRAAEIGEALNKNPTWINTE